MSENFSELIEYLDEKFGETEKEFKELKENFSKLATSVDGYALKADKYFQEFLMLAHKVERHEKWLLQIADKLGIKLEY